MSDLDKLSKLTKAELLAAIDEVRKWSPRYKTITSDLLHVYNSERNRRLLDASEKANKEQSEKMRAFLDFKREMVTKYGDGKTVKISALPRNEIERGAAIEQAYFDAVKKFKATQKALDDYYKEIQGDEE